MEQMEQLLTATDFLQRQLFQVMLCSVLREEISSSELFQRDLAIGRSVGRSLPKPTRA